MSRTSDCNPDILLAGYVRRTASVAAPDPPAAEVGDASAADLAVYEVRGELRRAQARIRHLEQALRAAGRVLAPYVGGNGR
jgi:hypothetical protein